MKTRILLTFLGLAAAVSAAPVTRDQLMAMAHGRVDPGVMKAIVERDCVDFDVDAGNAAELSRTVPPSVLEAAVACRRKAVPPAAMAAPAQPSGASPVHPATASPAISASASPASATDAAVSVPPPVSAAAPTSAAPEAKAPAPAPATSAGPAKIRLRAVFIGEAGALRCAASIDGVEAAAFLKEKQGEFGEAVPRDRIGRESAYLPVSAGSHHIVFRCDPKDQTVIADVDVPAGESRTIEIRETTLRSWKLHRIQTP